MKHIFLSLFLTLISFNSWAAEKVVVEGVYLERTNQPLAKPKTNREVQLIAHVKASISNSKKEKSNIHADILKIKGMSSNKVRHLLNNLCTLNNCTYLEIGVWQGSTWISALYNNERRIKEAVAIDNWSEFKGPQKEFADNCGKFLGKNKYSIVNQDCFSINVNDLTQSPVDIYFYDGEHSSLSQKLAYTYYDSCLADSFITIVDDWSWPKVRIGTFEAFDELGYEILFEEYLPNKEYWNGQYIAVIRKKK